MSEKTIEKTGEKTGEKTNAIDTKPLRSDDVIFFPAGGDLCLHHLGSGEYYLLNGMGEKIWNNCDGELTVSEMASRLAEEYDASTDEINVDLCEFLAYLEREDCLM